MYTSRSKTSNYERSNAPPLPDQKEGDGFLQEPEPIMEALRQITFAKSPVLETEQKQNTNMELQQKQELKEQELELKDTKPHFVLDFGDSDEVLGSVGDTTPVTVTTQEVHLPQISTEKTIKVDESQGKIKSGLVTDTPEVAVVKNWTSPEKHMTDNPVITVVTTTDVETGSRSSHGEFKNMSSQVQGPDRFSPSGGLSESRSNFWKGFFNFGSTAYGSYLPLPILSYHYKIIQLFNFFH